MAEENAVVRDSKVCIVCQQKISGPAVMVKEDAVINTIRGIKKMFNASNNNRLYVCDKDLPAYREKRKKFEKDMMLIMGMAAVIVILLVGVPLLSGRFQLELFVSSIFIALLVIVFGIVFKYVPAVEEAKTENKTGEKKKAEKTEKTDTAKKGKKNN